MRPLRLELEGFTAYREYTVLDFEGADLFVLTGPTGSGKSSVIDALTFALYGSVARYQNPNLVHPVISQGKLEARVRFDFAVEDRNYTAVRIVRKNARGGATTKEARLESEGHVLAGSADEVSRKVREVLGLNFDQFITCVVLPQGEFARFLHEKPADRQDLLTKLLGADIYGRMGNLARAREAASREAAKVLEDELERLRDASPAARKKAEAKAAALAGLQATIEHEQPELERLQKEAEHRRAEAERYEREAGLVRSLAIPKGVEALAEELERAKRALEEARANRVTADEAVQGFEQKRSKLPEAGKVHELDRAYRDRETKTSALETARANETRARDSVGKAEAERVRAGDRERAARAALEAARRELAAHDLASHLKSGEPCPVCGREIGRLPNLTLPPALSDAEDALRRVEKEARTVERAFHEASTGAGLAAERLASAERELRELESQLEGAPSPSELEKAKRLDVELAESRVLQRARREAEAEAERNVDKLHVKEKSAWSTFDAARDRVAVLEPPAAERTSLAEAWKGLANWASKEAARRNREAENARGLARTAAETRQERIEKLRESCRALDVVVTSDRLRDGVVTAAAAAEAELNRIQDALTRKKELRARIDLEREAAQVAGALGQHLRATGFERWLLEEAFRRLAEGATAILRELSSGQYSFEYDERLNFEVVDHRNADERRSARTLSGGETFLASLALALTLAEQTAELAAEGSARLESLFLDEGFGTLDDDTLEVVAAAIEELGAKGRIVGLVTHQQSLAEKIPVQFRVSKGPVTATVERVVA